MVGIRKDSPRMTEDRISAVVSLVPCLILTISSTMDAKLVYCTYTIAPIKIFRTIMSRNNVRFVCHAKEIDLKATAKIVLLEFDIDLEVKWA
jgi:hypothetical protein